MLHFESPFGGICYNYGMFTEQLAEAEQILQTSGVLPQLLRIINETWQDNLDRHDPAKGDDARTLGFNTAANVSNRLLKDETVRELEGVTVSAVQGWARLHHAGYELKAYKLPGLSATVSPHAATWDDSNAKQQGARDNTSAVQLALIPLDEVDSARPEAQLRLLHLVHTADEESGQVVAYLGFPRLDDDGSGPWYAVTPVTGSPRTATAAPAAADQAETRFTDRPLPEPAIRLRPERRSGTGL